MYTYNISVLRIDIKATSKGKCMFHDSYTSEDRT